MNIAKTIKKLESDLKRIKATTPRKRKKKEKDAYLEAGQKVLNARKRLLAASREGIDRNRIAEMKEEVERLTALETLLEPT